MGGTIYYLGPKETFAEQAARTVSERLGGDFILKPSATLSQAIRSLVAENDFAVLPYYNLYEGLIQETPDLIVENNLLVLAAQRVSVRFALGGYHAKNTETVIHSHPKALAQCSAFLSQHFPDAPTLACSSTVAAAEQVDSAKNGLVIARREALEKQNIPILHEDIGNRQYGRANFTEFLLIGKTSKKVPAHSEPTPIRTMIAVVPNTDRPGLLTGILGQISFFGINLLKIHSRPALAEWKTPVDSRNDPQMFYLEMETDSQSPEFQLCRESLKLRLSAGREPDEQVVRFLGEYPLFDTELAHFNDSV